jgi:phosphoesterase RecJ-like protein
VQIGAILEYRGNSVKGSFRAKDPAMRVDQLAARFGGGGHACAAGFNSEMTPEAFYPAMMDALREVFQPRDQAASAKVQTDSL